MFNVLTGPCQRLLSLKSLPLILLSYYHTALAGSFSVGLHLMSKASLPPTDMKHKLLYKASLEKKLDYEAMYWIAFKSRCICTKHATQNKPIMRGYV